jgi:hypothetical protein
MAKVSAELQNIYDKLYFETSLVTLKWHNYKVLFVGSKEHLELLEWAASAFFLTYNDAIVSDVFISLSRLTEEPKSKKGARISLGRLLLYIDSKVDNSFYKQFDKLVNEAKQNCSAILKHRNETVGHLNLQTFLNSKIDALPEITINQVDLAIQSIQVVLTTFAAHIFNESHLFSPFIVDGDAVSLINRLLMSEKAYDDDIKRLQN